MFIATVAFGAFAESNRPIKLFPDSLQSAVPEPISVFAEKYVGRIADMEAKERARRLDFDEVTLSFPLHEESFARMQSANKILMTLVDGKYYNIQWFKDADELASMSFPASYNLIYFTNQDESFQSLRQAILEAVNNPENITEYVGTTEYNPINVVQKSGEIFYLGNLTTDTYIDIISKKPVWGKEHPKESLANLFIAEGHLAPAMVDLSLESYDKEVFNITIPLSALNNVLKAEGNRAYFGISDEADDGSIEAVVLYHNPLFAYTHSLKVVYDSEQQHREIPTLKIKMLPYIKLHNLKNLWSEKEQ